MSAGKTSYVLEHRTAWIAALLLSACGGTETIEAAVGTVRIQFTVTNTVRASNTLTDSLTGTIYGDLFLAEEVGLGGPIDGAKELDQSIEIHNVDLEANEMSVQEWESTPLPPGQYIFLGFYDVDGNGEVDKSPDQGDPVTLPSNDFPIKEGLTTPHIVSFDLVFF